MLLTTGPDFAAADRCFLSLADRPALAVVTSCNEHETDHGEPGDHEGNSDHVVVLSVFRALPRRASAVQRAHSSNGTHAKVVVGPGAAKRSGAPADAGQGPECAARVKCSQRCLHVGHGFALEHFDAIGLWRETYAKDQRVDAQHLVTYALGRAPEFADRAVLDAIVKNLFTRDSGFKDLVRSLVLSDSFGKN
ncbi:MAG: DUF1585 domain-containing protein [Opitutaceae bacterium]|nr:DUF1585 domain-containing protein [Opitutaceae bacterium]